jgi:Kef-type K+ transport system membrane component KefB
VEQAHALAPAVILLAAGLLAILVARPLRLSPIVGFLAAGVAIGAHGLHAIEEGPTTHLLAELGVVFLLFDIGLHFSLKEVLVRRDDLLRLGPAQMLLCGAGLALGAAALGIDAALAAIVGASLGLSSTAVVSRVLAERKLQTCPLGRSATAVLVFQDLVAIFLLVFASSLAGDAASAGRAALEAAWKTAVAVGAALGVGRLAVGPAFRGLARIRNEEAFTAAALFVVLATAWATGSAGLSLTLGAFLAGMILADTPYRHVIQTELRPFRDLLMGFFFMSVGMALDPGALLRDLPAVLAIVAALLVAKTALVFAAARLSAWTPAGATQLGFLLAQGSEFALVVFALPGVAAMLSARAAGVLVASVALSLAVTPAWTQAGLTLARRVAARGRAPGEAPRAAPHDDRPIMIFAMNEVGSLAIDALRRHDVPTVAIEVDPDRFLAATADGYTVAFGDPADLRLIDAIGGTRARAIGLAEPRFDISRELTPIVRERYPDLGRFVAVADEADRERHAALGMQAVVTRGLPHGVEFAAALLAFAGVDAARVAEWMRSVRDAVEGGERAAA